MLFLHPNLESLEVHHATHGADMQDPPDEDSDIPMDYWRSPIFDADPGPSSTNLRTLSFHQCEIDLQALTKILSFPKELQHFTLIAYNFHPSNLAQGIQTAFEALRQQRHSLETLNIQGLKAHTDGIRLGNFLRLRILETGAAMLFGGFIPEGINNLVAGGSPLGFDLEGIFPRSLQQLTLRYRTVDLPITVRRLEAMASWVKEKPDELPDLRRVLLIEEKRETECLAISPDVKETFEGRLVILRERLTSIGVDVKHEVEEFEPEPWPPRLQEVMGYVGNPKYKESYERRWGIAT